MRSWRSEVKHAANRYGALITALVVAAILFSLFHKTILQANQVSFARGGDGHKSTFCTLYHIKYDSAYWHTMAMNYPFGESVFFTGNQVVLTNTIKLLKDLGWDLSNRALGISNLLILFSFVIAAFFIYLIFKELKVDWWMAMPATLIIVLLSNQWERLGGHYNLAYAYTIPVILYLLLRFYRKPSYGLSILVGLLVVLFSAKHLYIAAFILILWVPYWIFLPLLDKERFGRPGFILAHVLIQFVLPFLIFNLFTGMHDPGLDRTTYPWGFYPSRVRLEAVFLPLSLPHGKWMSLGPVRMQAYVGLLGTIVALIILMSTLRRLLKGRGWGAFQIGEAPVWNVLFWAGVAGLLLALGLPFSPNWEGLLNHAGPYRQLRAVGRFVFPFYYLMCITSFYYLWRWHRDSKLRIAPFLLIAAVLFTGYESYFHVRKRPAQYHHPISWHSELYHEDATLEWMEDEDFSAYQAILPLPYFHIGSENYWIGDRSPVRDPAYAVSLKSGLPITAVMLSRTSIRQTLKNTDLIREPYHSYEYIEDLPDSRPFLLLVHKKAALSEAEEDLVRKGLSMAESEEVRIYELGIDSLNSLVSDRKEELLKLAAKAETNDSSILFEDFSSLEEGRFAAEFRKPVTFFEEVVPDTGIYMVSFWFEGADRDLWPRTNFWTELYGEEGNKYHYAYTDFFRKMVLRKDSWGLIEYPVHVKESGTTLKISIRNKVISGGQMFIDRVLVRPVGSTHLSYEDQKIWINNRQVD